MYGTRRLPGVTVTQTNDESERPPKRQRIDHSSTKHVPRGQGQSALHSEPARLVIWKKIQALDIFAACGRADHDSKYPNSPVVDWNGGSMCTQEQSLKPIIDCFINRKEETHTLRRATCITLNCFATLKVHVRGKNLSPMNHWKNGKDRPKHKLRLGDDIEFWQLPSKALRATVMVLGSRELKVWDGLMWAVVGLEDWGRGT